MTDPLAPIMTERYDRSAFIAELSAEADITVDAIEAMIGGLERIGLAIHDAKAKPLTPEYFPGKLDGTLHRVENGRRTGVMWGPSVEGNWYASLARIADGYTFKFVEQSHAEAFLRAEINPSPAAYTQPMHYSYRIGKYQHFMWFVNPAAAHRSAGDEEHQLIAEPCPCTEPHPETQP